MKTENAEMDENSRVLFICRHNAGRSQIAEALLKKMTGGKLAVESAGFSPASAVNPLVATVMQEQGIDLSGKKPQSVFELFKQGRIYTHVITVCDDSESDCPIYPGIARRLHHPFPDPAKVEGSEEEKLARVREIRDLIKQWLEQQVSE
ncbi:MAG: arsenate reductase ArsC [Desulfobacterales bacterium]|nr:arsenate reductase ArsC [Desulfobacterales bacterium]